MTGASAALAGSFRNTVSATAPTRKAMSKAKKSRQPFYKNVGVDQGVLQLKVWVRVWQHPTFQKRHPTSTTQRQQNPTPTFLTDFPIKSTIDQLLRTPQF
jgi:hypothetical protein